MRASDTYKTPTIAVLMVVGTATALGAAVPNLTVSSEVIFLILTALVLALPMAYRLVNGTFEIFEPITAFVFVYAILFVIRPAYMYANDVDYFQITNEVAYIGDSLAAMQFGALVGAIGFVFTYELVPTEKFTARLPSKSELSAESIARGAVVIFFLGTVGSAIFVSAVPGGLQTLIAGRTEGLATALLQTSGYLVYAPTLLVPASLMLMVAWMKTRENWLLIASIAAALLLVIVKGPTGGRIALLPLFGGFIVYLYLVRGRTPRFLSVLVVLLVGMFIWTFVGQVRDQETRRSEGTGKLARGLLAEPIKLIDPITIGQDAGMAPGLAAGMSVVPNQIPYTNGLGMVTDFASRGIPRTVWPDKPPPPREKFVSLLWPNGYSRGLANPEPSVLFSFYAELGFIGIALGMSLIGWTFSVIRGYVALNRDNSLILLIYGIYLTSIPTILRDSPPDSMLKIGFTIVPIIIVVWLGSQRSAAN